MKDSGLKPSVLYGVRSTHAPDVSLEDKYLTSLVYSPYPRSPQPASQLQAGPQVSGLRLQHLFCSHTPTWMCPLLLQLLPLFTGSVFWVERLPLVISRDDLPMERALYNKHKAADGQE